MDSSNVQSNSASWMFFVKFSFGAALGAIVTGILLMPGGLLVQGYFAICSLFLVSATITLSKTLRDDHESQRLFNKINEAKTNKILNEFSE
jgi:hypothetical protein